VTGFWDRPRTALQYPSRYAPAPGPAKATDQLPRANPAARFNAWFAVKITSGVGTMWCGYAFAALALASLPSAISSHKLVVLVS
jgi:hypothetical protein